MLNIKSARFTCLSIILVALYAAPLSAQTYIYNTITDGNWTSASTWRSDAGKPPVSGNCDCIIYVNPGNRLTINQNINISNAQIILLGDGSELRFSSAILLPPTMKLTGTSSIELRHSGANIESTSNLLGYNGNSISINGTSVFQGYSTEVNSSSPGVVNGLATANSSMSPPAFVSNMILPVKLIEFGASESGGKVILRWKTSAESNFDYFEIERSVNGKDWSKIGTVNGQGEGYTTLVYSFTDLLPAASLNYYRLKMMDINSQFVYSSIVVVNIPLQHEQVKVYPNPAVSVLHVSNIQSGVRYYIELINTSGRVVLGKEYYSLENTITINIGSFGQGMYFLKISDATGSTQTCSGIIIK